MKLKKFIAMMAVTAMVAGMATGCGGSKSDAGSDSTGSDTKTESLSGTITAAGSSALKPLADDAADSFLNENPDVSITIDAGGSGEGLKQVSEGTVDIGNSDVAAEDKLDADKAKELVDHQVCVITMAPIVNEDVAKAGVKSLTKEQLISIFTGKTTNWKEVGGADAEIVVVSREDGSGTRDGFQEIVGFESGDLTSNAQISDGSGNIKSIVEGNENAIGYISFGYVDENVNALTIDGVELNAENVKNDSYAIARPFLFANKEDVITEQGKNFIDFILSEEGQNVVEENGFISVN